MNTITENAFLRQELIGLKIKVMDSSNPLHKEITGEVRDETKNTIVILSNSKNKRIPKKDAIYGFITSNGRFIEISGKRLLGRPADRINKRIGRRQP